MKQFDRYLQTQRILKAQPYIKPGMRVLDIGSSDGELFRQIPGIGEYVGVDPALEATTEIGKNARLVKGMFPGALADQRPFDCITLLAVLEHIDEPGQRELARGCNAFLRPGGHLVITTPSPMVDHILTVLQRLRIVDAMTLEEHYGFDVWATPGIFTSGGLELVRHQRFQLGLNHVFVFRKPEPR